MPLLARKENCMFALKNDWLLKPLQKYKNLVKKRQIATKNRIYIQDIELLNTVFKPHTGIKVEIDKASKTLTILPAINSSINVSKRYEKAVIDLRSKSVRDFIESNEKLELIICENQIIVKGFNTDSDNQISFAFEHQESRFKGTNFTDRALEVVSLCCGVGMLDLPFVVENGFNIKYAIDCDPDTVKTYKMNVSENAIVGDISTASVPDAEILLTGMPCFGFSNSNRKNGDIDNKDNWLIYKLVEIIKSMKKLKVVVMEEVPQFVSKFGGHYFKILMDALKDFNVSYKILDASAFGSVQTRKRFVMIASKLGKVELKDGIPHLPITVSQALSGITEDTPNYADYSKPSPVNIERMKHVKPGENYKSIPDLRDKNHHSIYFKRLDPNHLAPTIVNPRKAMILNPNMSENRIISIAEARRLFGLKDDFVFHGTLGKMQQMVCNGVPYELSKYLAITVRKHLEKFNFALG